MRDEKLLLISNIALTGSNNGLEFKICAKNARNSFILDIIRYKKVNYAIFIYRTSKYMNYMVGSGVYVQKFDKFFYCTGVLLVLPWGVGGSLSKI